MLIQYAIPSQALSHTDTCGEKMRPRRLYALRIVSMCVLAGMAVGLLGACTPAQKPHASAAPHVVNPLTGKKGKALDRPAVSVKIPADHAARPQSGLNAADNVWVELVEGGEIRYNTVFYTHLPSSIGPVRSVRPVDAEINGSLHGVFACSGGQDDFLDQVKEHVGVMYTEESAGKAMWRISSRKAPYNLYASAQKLVDKADKENLKSPRAQWSFASRVSSATATTTGHEVESLSLMYPSALSVWTWKDGSWERSDGQRPLLDEDDRAVTTTNVVALAVQTHTTDYVDPAGIAVVDSQLVGSGEAKVASGGRVLDAQWEKKSPNAVVVLRDSEGKVIRLAPGKTWIEVVPRSAQWFHETASSSA